MQSPTKTSSFSLFLSYFFLKCISFIWFLAFQPSAWQFFIDPMHLINHQLLSTRLLKNSRFFVFKVDYLPSKCTCFSFCISFPILLLSFLTRKWLKAWSYNFLISCIFIYQMEAEVFPSAVVCKQCQLDSCSAPSLGQSRERQRDVLHYKWDLVSYARQGSIKALSKKVSEGKKAES